MGGWLYRRRFESWLHASLISVTCDGSIGYPVRKFFEIPACGSILAAQFFRNPEKLGFLDGQNCFALNGAPERLLDLVATLRGDPERAAVVAAAGQDMVRELHALSVRVRQFLEIAAAVADHSLVTTRWEAGRQVLVTRAS